MFERARATTKIIDSPDELEGFTDLNDADKDLIKGLIAGGFVLQILCISCYSCSVFTSVYNGDNCRNTM